MQLFCIHQLKMFSKASLGVTDFFSKIIFTFLRNVFLKIVSFTTCKQLYPKPWAIMLPLFVTPR